MSSLAATQADGMYIPPSYLESGAYKKKSLNQYAGSKGHNQYLQRSVCRFELPFDGFCTKCDAIVGKGTRFNAHKAHVDDYFTTKIYEFTTRCRACGDCEFKMRTNPKERTFDYVSGIRKKVEEFDTAEAGTGGVIDTEIGNGILEYKNGRVLDAPDGTALNLLEKSAAGHRKAQTEHEHMTSLIELNAKMGEDADANASIRAAFRKDRKAKRRRLGEAAGMGLGKGIELAGETEEDVVLARRAMEGRRTRCEGGRAKRSEEERFRSVRTGSIFGSGKKSRGAGASGRGRTTAASVEKARKKSVGGEGGKPVPKRKIAIRCEMMSRGDSTEPTRGETSLASNDGALAALSGLYASDSD